MSVIVAVEDSQDSPVPNVLLVKVSSQKFISF